MREIPKGSKTFLSAGCAGLWFFEWIEQCYGKIDTHIGLEYYMPKPDGLPENVKWIANTCSDMSDVASASCDLVFSGQNFEHLWPDELFGFMLEASRVLKPGGLLVMDSPNRTITEALGNWSHPEHTVEATLEEAVKITELAGFDVVAQKGIWLGRDPETKETLPFVPVETKQWSVTERLLAARGKPEDSFIWWIEARRAERAPDVDALRAYIDAMFDRAWPERISRVQIQAGTEMGDENDRWIRGSGEAGFLKYGPYAPLRAGRYTVGFDLDGEPNDGSGPDAVCDVVGADGQTVIVSKEVRVSGPTRVELEFSIPDLQFGMQFRCQSLGTRVISCRKNTEIVKHS